MDFLKKLLSLGPEKIQLLNDPQARENFNHENVISTGILALDIASGIGGLPRNRVIEIFGVEGGGKSTICGCVCAQFHARGLYTAYIDVEHAVDKHYFKKLGVMEKYFALSQPSDGEEAMEIALELADSPELGLIVIDSAAALMTKQELEGELTDANVGATARLIARSLRKLVPKCSVHNTMLIFTNQLRDNIGAFFGSKTTTPGGRSLRYAASIRLEVTRIGTNKEGKLSVSNATQAKFIKNRLAPPFVETKFDIVFGQGADNYKTLFEEGINKKVISKKGSVFYYGEQELGKKDKAIEFLENNKDIKKKIWTQISQGSKKRKPKLKKKTAIKEVSVSQEHSEPTTSMSGVLLDV